MPNWKKIIVSGSDASLNSLYVNGAITASTFSGSVIGYATTGSNSFRGSEIISGSLTISGSGTSVLISGAVNINAGTLAVITTQSLSWGPASTAGVVIGNTITGSSLLIRTPAKNGGFDSGLGIDGIYDGAAGGGTKAEIRITAFGTYGDATVSNYHSDMVFGTTYGSASYESLRLTSNAGNRRAFVSASLIASGTNGHTLTGNTVINGRVAIGTNAIDSNTNLYIHSSQSFNWAPSTTAATRIGIRGSGSSFIVETPSLNVAYSSGFGISGSYDTGSKKSEINLIGYGVYSGGGYYSDLVFNTTSNTTLNTQMRISGSGKIIMGGTSDLSDVVSINTATKGQVYIGTSGASSANFGITAVDSAGTTKPLVLQPYNNGYVGIGTKSVTVSSKLHMEDGVFLITSASTAEKYGRIVFAESATRYNNNQAAIIESTKFGWPNGGGVDQADLRFSTAYGANNGERFRIDGFGNVIINATMPVSHSTSHRLNVSGSALITNGLTVSGSFVYLKDLSSATVANVVGYNTTTGQLTYQLAGSSGTESDPIFTARSASLATTGSNFFNGNQTITGSILVSGSTAAVNISGSLSVGTGNVPEFQVTSTGIRAGNVVGDTHNITGSVNITGSLLVNTLGTTEFQVTSTGTKIGNITADTHTITGSINVSGSSNFTGSLSVNLGSGTEFEVTSTGIRAGNIISDVHNITGSLNISGSLLISGAFGNAGGYIQPTADGIRLGNSVSGIHITLRSSNRTEFGQSVGLNNPSGFGYSASDRLTINTTDNTEASTGIWIGNSTNQNILKAYGNAKVQISGSLEVTASSIVNNSAISAYGSGSSKPVLDIQGSLGDLFKVTDIMSGSLFSVNNSSGLPIVEVFSDSTTRIGTYPVQAMYTTNQIVTIASANNTIYQLRTGSYDAVWMDYVARSGSISPVVRTGQFMTTWSGSRATFTDISASSLPTATSTNALAFSASIASGNVTLFASSSSPTWTIKTIIRTI